MTGNNPQKTNAASSSTQMQRSQPAQPPHSGDDAAPGTPGTGEDICPQCHGSGRIDGSPCPNCGGTGKIIKAVGGA